MKHVPLRACVAEFIGTFLLATGVGISIAMPLVGIPTAVVAGLILGTAVYTVGGISGAHLNPAVTLALLSVKKMKGRDAFWYIVAQVLGGIVALLCQMKHYPLALPTSTDNIPLQIVAEILGAFVLMWGIASVVYSKTQSAANGLTIGASLTIGAIVSAMGSLSILNPAVAIGLHALTPVYLLAPIAGTLLSVHLYRWVVKAK